MRSLHHLDGHLGWDAGIDPVLRISPGEELELVLADCFGGQLAADATPADVAALDLSRANPLTGPVHVDGAQPGDALVIDVLDVTPAATGWTAIIPGFGLLADDFPEPHVVVSELLEDRIAFGELAILARRPFLGTIGVAPGEPGPHSVIPPRRVGGNLDCRDVAPGAQLVLPVEVPGALLSAGDPHGTQGDGEVCGTAVETSAVARVRVGLRAGAGEAMRAPQLRAPAARDGGHAASDGDRWITLGVAPDLHVAAVAATRAMIERLDDERRLTPPDAYALCSVAAHLRIAEVVDAPNWVVACELDTSVLR